MMKKNPIGCSAVWWSPDFDNGTPKLEFWWKKRFYC